MDRRIEHEHEHEWGRFQEHVAQRRGYKGEDQEQDQDQEQEEDYGTR